MPIWNLGFPKALDGRLYWPGPGTLNTLSCLLSLLEVPKPTTVAFLIIESIFGSYAVGAGVSIFDKLSDL